MPAVNLTNDAVAIVRDLKKRDQARYRKVQKAIRNLKSGPEHPGLRTKGYNAVTGPNGERLFQSYVENNTPGAWRMWWFWGPGEDVITISAIGKHP